VTARYPLASLEQGRVKADPARPHPAHRAGQLIIGNRSRKIINVNEAVPRAPVFPELA
jgi:hypothetical protein